MESLFSEKTIVEQRVLEVVMLSRRSLIFTFHFLGFVLELVCPVELVSLVDAAPHSLPQLQLLHKARIRSGQRRGRAEGDEKRK